MLSKQELEKELLSAAKTEFRKLAVRREKMAKSKGRFQRTLDAVDRETAEMRNKANALKKRMETLKRSRSFPQQEMNQLSKELSLLEFRLDPALQEINRRFREQTKTTTSLTCPNCGESDKGNKMNGKPWCFKCNTVLVPKDKVAKWKGQIKVLPKSLKDELKRLNPGLEPDNKEDAKSE
jgi:cell division protein FtsB